VEFQDLATAGLVQHFLIDQLGEAEDDASDGIAGDEAHDSCETQ
jgi:hypothetical protein